MNTTLTRTICIALDVEGHDVTLAATHRAFNAAASWIAQVCWDEDITNTNTAHHRVYGATRLAYGLGAQLACCARAKAVQAITAVKAKKTPAGDTIKLQDYRDAGADEISFYGSSPTDNAKLIGAWREHSAARAGVA